MRKKPPRLFAVFVDMLWDALESKGMTQQELARKSGVHFVTINRILNGAKDSVSFRIAEALMDAADIDVKKFLRKI